MLQHAGAARWAYNWGLRVKRERYQATTKSPSAIDLHRELNALKKTEVPWMYQVSKCAPQEALRNLDAAFKNFFRRCALKKQGKWKEKLGYPRFKTKKKGLGSFRLTGTIVVSARLLCCLGSEDCASKNGSICRQVGCGSSRPH
jgi:putative transposase